MTTITKLTAYDLRFPTSRLLDGSDAMNPDPDYSAAYVVLHTDTDLTGYGFTFTIGRGNEVCVAAIEALAPLVVGQPLATITADMGAFYQRLTGDSQLRWLGPEKGVIHLATAAVINAVWDLWARQADKPLWLLLADMTPAELVRCVDFTYITDAITPDQALALLTEQAATKSERIAHLKAHGYPAYTTSAGWLGYSDDKLRRLCREMLADGWTHFKIKVGRDVQDDIRRCRIIREEIGDDKRLMVDANQVWDVDQAIEWMKQLASFNPHWIEEPTSPDDILGHATIRGAISPTKVATGEHCQNRVLFKQLMQAEAIDFCQIDACRLGGVNEVIAVYLMAAQFGVPVCPHAGGVGLCEYVQHLQMFDYICVSGTTHDRIVEYTDHLHEHFVDPVTMRNGHYMPPTAPGYSAQMLDESVRAHIYPTGAAWAEPVS
jgi:L-fuconate dehydratase